jgi:hypothetical protein
MGADTGLLFFNEKVCPDCKCTSVRDEFVDDGLLIVMDAAEGMASWRFGLSEMIFFARIMNMRLVLPCVLDGRMAPCTLPRALPLEAYVDVDRLIDKYIFRDRIVTFDALLRLNQTTEVLSGVTGVLCVHHACHHRGFDAKRRDTLSAKDGLGLLPRKLRVFQIHNKLLPAFITKVRSMGKTVVLTDWFKGSFKLGWLRNKPADGSLETFGLLRWIDFSPKAYYQADRLRIKLNLTEDYVAVHWRSERTNCNYLTCAAELAAAVQDIYETTAMAYIAVQPGKSKCLLVSDIPMDPNNVLWAPFVETELGPGREGRAADMATALETLGVTKHQPWGGCAKLDTVATADKTDTGLLSIYDKILGMRALDFYTCRHQFSNTVCGKCARTQSNFALEIVDLRKKHKKRIFQLTGVNIKGLTSLDWPHSYDYNLTTATGADHHERGGKRTESVKVGQDTAVTGPTPAAATACSAMLLLPEQRHYIPKEAKLRPSPGGNILSSGPKVHHFQPPILWTFSGSGNTWCRMLLEQSTGFLTGSVYNDPSLNSMFRAESRPASIKNVVAVKAHPNVKLFGAEKLRRTFGDAPPLVLVVRDPYRTLWSEGQRRITRTLKKKGQTSAGAAHTHKLQTQFLASKRGWAKWEELAFKLGADYLQMWKDYADMIKGGSPFVLVAFEDLQNAETQAEALERILDFIGAGWDRKRVSCAFELGDNSEIRRADPDSTSGDATLLDAFPENEAIGCELWAIFSNARDIALELGYIWKYRPPNVCGDLREV